MKDTISVFGVLFYIQQTCLHAIIFYSFLKRMYQDFAQNMKQNTKYRNSIFPLIIKKYNLVVFEKGLLFNFIAFLFKTDPRNMCCIIYKCL